jgi:S-DNA-T family DNA segregation ATPase FtsK/SpoIIIE
VTQSLLVWALIVFVGMVLWGAPRLRARHPHLWWAVIGFPRAVFRVMFGWRRLAVLCDLAVPKRPPFALLAGLVVRGQSLRMIPPRIGIPRKLPAPAVGFTVSVRLHPGQVPDDVAHAAYALAHAWRMHSIRVTSPVRGRALLTCLAVDPLADIEPARLVDAAAEVPTDLAELLRADLGRREDGTRWVINLRRVPHWLVVGATDSGKSTWVSALVTALAPRPVALVGIDCKGGMELSLYEPRLSALATNRTQAAGLLAALVAEIEERMMTCRLHGVRSVWDLPEDVRPVPIVVIVDEVAELFLTASRAERDEAAQVVTALVRTAQLGRALAAHLVIAGQRVGSELGPGATALRAQLGGRVCHRVSDPETAAMALGDVNASALDAAQTIAPYEAGTAVTSDGAGWLRARADYVSAGDAAMTAQRFAHITPHLPEFVAALTSPAETADLRKKGTR